MKTDTQLQQDVNAELKWEPAINAADIGVEVKDGIVTLAGHVGSYSEKWDAERAAQRVAGIKGLAIEMDVKLPGSSQRTDADIARAAENVLSWSTYVPDDSIKIMVEKGWITLTGEVRWDFERRGAAAAIRHLKEKVSPVLLKAEIEAAFKRRAQNDAKSISVAVNGTNVTLSGSVHTWPERDLANNTAWSAPGVWKVIDNITISY